MVAWAALLSAGCREGTSGSTAATTAQPLAAAPDPSAPLTLELIDDFNPPRPAPSASPVPGSPSPGSPSPGTPSSPSVTSSPAPVPPPPAAAWDAAVGGLSGLFYSEREQLLYAISDDRGRFPARMYTFTVELGEHALRVIPRSVLLLHERTPSDALIELDSEGLAGNASMLFLSAEGNEEPPSQRETRILRLERDGLVTSQLELPAAFRPAASGEPARGARPNLGLEGLTLSPSGRFLFACAETALYQDGDVASFDAGTTVRIARWDLEHPGEPTQYAYRTDPVTPRLDAASIVHNGVSEITALDDEQLLVMERAYVAAPAGPVNTIRIFQADLTAGSASAGDLPPLAPKRLVLDLGSVVAGFDEGRRELDNFEGMTLGPRLASGHRSLLLVSDDNFSARQRTVFVALELRPGH